MQRRSQTAGCAGTCFAPRPSGKPCKIGPDHEPRCAHLMNPSSDNLVEITDVKFNYGEREVLKGLSLRIPRGRVVAILGASGCGKSTLLRLIGGQEKPAQGSVRVDGQVVHELDTDGLYQLRRRMGMMFQAGGPYPDRSVYENIAFPLRENSDLPEELIRSLILMKLHVVGL